MIENCEKSMENESAQAKHDLHLLKNFYVIIVITNPVRFKTRYKLFEEHVKHLKQSGVNYLIVEGYFGDRTPKVTEKDNPQHIQVQLWDEIWHKENLINIGISRLPSDWEYCAWVDADIEFLRKDWALETVQQLQHHFIVQMFQTAVDLGPSGEVFQTYKGFGWSYVNGMPYQRGAGKYYPYWHPGYAWAARREAIDYLGGLIDFAIVGAGDHHMALSLINRAVDSIPSGINKNYVDMIMQWQDRANKHIRGDIGYVPGTIAHSFHGSKINRGYWSRWDILKKHNFDPTTDLKKDWQGVYHLAENERTAKLRDDLRIYFRQRNEDSTDLIV